MYIQPNTFSPCLYRKSIELILQYSAMQHFRPAQEDTQVVYHVINMLCIRNDGFHYSLKHIILIQTWVPVLFEIILNTLAGLDSACDVPCGLVGRARCLQCRRCVFDSHGGPVQNKLYALTTVNRSGFQLVF